MSRFFLLTGGLSFVAFGFAVTGLLYSNQDLVLTKPVRLLSGSEWQMFEFLDYNSFPNFAAHCCCKERPKDLNQTATHISASDRVELWICDNGFRKERLRETYYKNDLSGLMQLYNGSKFRPFCGRNFPPGYCPPKYDPDVGRFKSYTCNTTKYTQKFDSKVLTYLW